MNFSIEIQGEKQFSQAIDRFDGLVTDMHRVWPLCAEIFYRIEIEQFASEGSRGAEGRWKPLSPGYARWKAINYGDLPILFLTGEMKRSLLGVGPNAIKIETPSSLTLGTTASRKGFFYPVAHQLGGTKAGRPPRRRPIDLTRNDYGKFVSRVFRYFNDGVEAVGFVPKKGRGIRSIQAS